MRGSFLVGTMDHIGADRRGLCAVEHRRKRRHAAFLQGSLQHDTVPSVHGDEGRATKVRSDPARYQTFAMTNTAILRIQSLARRHRGWARSVGWWIDHQLRFGRQGWQLSLCAKFKNQQSTDIALIARFIGLLPFQEGIGPAPSGQHCNVLLAFDLAVIGAAITGAWANIDQSFRPNRRDMH